MRFVEAAICDRRGRRLHNNKLLISTGEEKTYQSPNANSNADGLIGMITDNLIRGFGAFDGSLLNLIPGFLALLKR